MTPEKIESLLEQARFTAAANSDGRGNPIVGSLILELIEVIEELRKCSK